jgi:ATP-dependent DNA helicase RecQ
VLLAMRSDLGRLIRFNQRRAIDPAGVEAYVTAMRKVADEGRLIIDAPAADEDRIRLAVAERVGACTIEPAGGGRLLVELGGSLDRRAVAAICAVAKDRGWRAYRAVEAFSFSSECRRRLLLDHFGDRTAGAPSGRCCDACDPADWLPDPASLPVPGRRRASRDRAPQAEVRLSTPDAELFEQLRAWRAKAAAGKPAYTVARDSTLRDIAVARPADAAALRDISGVGPAFVSRHADEVLALVGN